MPEDYLQNRVVTQEALYQFELYLIIWITAFRIQSNSSDNVLAGSVGKKGSQLYIIFVVSTIKFGLKQHVI